MKMVGEAHRRRLQPVRNQVQAPRGRSISRWTDFYFTCKPGAGPHQSGAIDLAQHDYMERAYDDANTAFTSSVYGHRHPESDGSIGGAPGETRHVRFVQYAPRSARDRTKNANRSGMR
jgi:hypothetical protein